MTANSATDVIISGDTAREKDYHSTKKAGSIASELALGIRRKKSIKATPFLEFAELYGLMPSIRDNCGVARFESGLPAPGISRNRGTLFGQKLVWTSPEMRGQRGM